MSDDHDWGVGVGVALALVGVGILLAQTLLVVAAVIPLGYLLYGALSTLPDDVSLAANREFEETSAAPGGTVSVTLTVENTGTALLPDVRIIDDVPDELAVTAGTPRRGIALEPGDRVTIEYTVVLKRGRFEFGDPAVRLRSMAGTDSRTERVPTSGESALASATPVSEPPVSEVTLSQSGAVPADTGGAGQEFYATRQYHPGDPMNRIDWHHAAKTGEFVTVQYRRERAARSVVIVDCRPCTRTSPEQGYPTGATMAVYAGERLYRTLDAAGVLTTLTAVGLGDELDHLTDADGLPWVTPGADDSRAPTTLFRGLHGVASREPGASLGKRERQQSTLRPTADGGSPPQSAWTEKLRSRLPAESQLIFCTPLVDEWPVEFTRELTDRECLLISPDLTVGSSLGQRVERIDRRRRLTVIERTGTDTVDWRIDRPLEQTLKEQFPERFR